jgi:hypothetical protein
LSAEWKQKGSERECWGGGVTVISIQLCFFCLPSGSRKGSGRECWGGSVTVISIHLSVFCQPSGSRRVKGGM